MIGKKIVLLIVFCALIPATLAIGEKGSEPWWPDPELRRTAMPWVPRPHEVLIGPIGVSVPLGRILLVRRDFLLWRGAEYLALKFTNSWLGETIYDHYTSYEFYYQGDGSGDFSKSNVGSGTGEFYAPPMTRSLHAIRPSKRIAQFGKIKIKWIHVASVDYGRNEVAPTPWTSITEVNIHDPKLQWYGKNNSRKRRTVPIDQLWE